MNAEDSSEVAQNMNWNTIAEGLKPHEPTYPVVVHGVPKDIDFTNPQVIESLTEINHTKENAIVKITPLRRNLTKAKHHSIGVFGKYAEDSNTWIEKGFSINYQIH